MDLFLKHQQLKHEQAKLLLTSLSLPKAQCNDRSAWVLLALANIKPDDDWSQSRAPFTHSKYNGVYSGILWNGLQTK